MLNKGKRNAHVTISKSSGCAFMLVGPVVRLVNEPFAHLMGNLRVFFFTKLIGNLYWWNERNKIAEYLLFQLPNCVK